MRTLSIDFETRSTVDLKKAGVYVYAEHPSTEVLCMAWAFDDDEPELECLCAECISGWGPRVNKSCPGPVREHVAAGGSIRAWNAQFERCIWREVMVKRFGWPEAKLEQWYCTAADAAAMALPRALDQAARALNLTVQKDDAGKKLMLRMCKPRKPRKGEDPDAILWVDSPEERAQLGEYCRQDVRTERAVHNRIRTLSDFERRVYLLDQRINDRGVLIDAPLVAAAQEIVQVGTERANAELVALTDGKVQKVTKATDLRMWLNAAGLDIGNVKKDTLRDALAGEKGELPEDVHRVIELRAETAKSSTAKLNMMVSARCADHRARGTLLYHGAGTGRWSGKLLQPQNFPRPAFKGVEDYIQRVMEGSFDLIEIERPALVVISSMLRAMLRAAPGTRFMSADYSQIEARIVAWIAEQDDLVELFAKGGKIYETMAAAIFNMAVADVTKDGFERQVGKNTVLGCGFGMGWTTFQAQIKVQTGLDISDEVAQAAVSAYRTLYYRIKQFWREINTAALMAVQYPGSVQHCGRGAMIKFTVRSQFLWCILPSGRPLAYALPRIERRTVTPKVGEPFTVMSVTFMGVNSMTKQWQRHAGYGGLWTENVVQAMARDLMAGAMLRVEDAGYRPVLTVHDEVLCEVPEDHGSLDEYLGLMRVIPKWATGLPVAAEGWVGERYRK